VANRQDLVFELFYNGVWNVVPLLPNSGAVVIERGEKSEGSSLTPSSATIVINNRSTIYNPTYPLSPLYGPAGLNTPGRLTMPGTDRRMVGEVASWDPDQTPDFNPTTGRGNAWTTVELAGPLRRPTQNEEALPSTLRGFIDAQPGQQAYFPGEDGTDATAPSNVTPAGYPATVVDVGFGADDTLLSSGGVVRFNSALSSFSARVKDAPVTGFITGVLLFKLNALPGAVFELFRLEATGTAAVISIAIDNVAFGINISTSTGGALVSFGPAHQVDPTQWVALHIGLSQTSAGVISYAFYRHEAGNALIFGSTGTFAGTLGRATKMVMAPAAGRAQMRMAHWVVTNDAFPFVTSGLRKAVAAWAGFEAVYQRLQRMMDGVGIPYSTSNITTQLLGAQRAGQTFTDVTAESLRTDDGMFRERRDALGVRFITRKDISAATLAAPTLTLDYAAGDVGIPTKPKLDDLKVVNDVTAARPAGGSARVQLDDGPLSVQPQPAGVGRYDKKYDVNPVNDDPLPLIASWLMRKGTTGERRFPVVTVKKASLLTAAAVVDIGDMIRINNMPAWVSPDPVSLIVVGITERTETHERIFSFNCIPARGYEVGVWNTSRWNGYATTNATIITGTATSMVVNLAAGAPAWTTAGGHFPIDIDLLGARVRVTAITGTGPQTFTISASVVNGIAKTIPAGSPVLMWKPARYAL